MTVIKDGNGYDAAAFYLPGHQRSAGRQRELLPCYYSCYYFRLI
jgi:hypothetical protein